MEAPPPRRSWTPVLIALAVVVALVAGGVVFLASRGGSQEALALSFVEGSDSRYHLVMSLDGRLASGSGDFDVPITETVDATFVLHVDSVDAQGAASVDMTMQQLTLTVNGEKQTIDAGGLSHLKIARDGRLLEDDGGVGAAAQGSGGISLPGVDQFTPLLPDHPVGPGDSWTKSFDTPFPLGGGTLRYSSQNSFLRYEDADGTRAAVIQSKVSLPLDLELDLRDVLAKSGEDQSTIPAGTDPKIAYGGTMTMTTTSWFDPAVGQQLRSRVSGSMDIELRFEGFPASEGLPSGGLSLTGSVRMSLDRLP